MPKTTRKRTVRKRTKQARGTFFANQSTGDLFVPQKQTTTSFFGSPTVKEEKPASIHPGSNGHDLVSPRFAGDPKLEAAVKEILSKKS